MFRQNENEVEWNQGWPIRHADNLSGNRLLSALSCTACEETIFLGEILPPLNCTEIYIVCMMYVCVYACVCVCVCVFSATECVKVKTENESLFLAYHKVTWQSTFGDFFKTSRVFIKSFLGWSTSQVVCEVAWQSRQSWPCSTSDQLVSLWHCGLVVSHCLGKNMTDVQKVGEKMSSLTEDETGVFTEPLQGPVHTVWFIWIHLIPVTKKKSRDVLLHITKLFGWCSHMDLFCSY